MFEVYRPNSSRPSSAASSQHDSGVWLRGYVVSTSPLPQFPSSSSDISAFPSAFQSGTPLAEEPQVSVGIFPAAHVHIREELEDAERRLAELRLAAPDTPRSSGAARMAVLREEEEEEQEPSTPFTAAARSLLNGLRSPTTPDTKRRNRASVSSVASFAAQLSTEQQLVLQSSRGSLWGGPGQDVDTRPAPPLPNLKCGDETASGAVEPLVDEIACALREWATLLYTHLHRRDYALFESVRAHIDALHAGRRQLLARTLGVDETDKLRRELVRRLVQGNVEQGLDVIVRHPAAGGLVDVDVEGGGEVDKKGWVSVVRMCEWRRGVRGALSLVLS